MNATLPKSATSPQRPSVLPDEWIERLFLRFSAMYGSRFSDMWRGCDLSAVKAAWAEDLGGLTRDELRRGVDACKTREWPPTLPEFVKLCRPPISAEAAFREAVEQTIRRDQGRDQWSHPAIFWAAQKITAFELKNRSWRELEAVWRDEFGKQLARGEWPPIPERLEALPAPGETMPDKERADQYVAGAVRATSTNRAADDPMRWAKDAKARYLAGEALPYQLQVAASEALREVWRNRACESLSGASA